MHWAPISSLLLCGSFIMPVVDWLLWGPAADPISWRAVWQRALPPDLMFVAAAATFLQLAVHYGASQHGERAVPYPGAWMDASGRQRCPPGFMGYLPLAGLVSLVFPAVVLAATLLLHGVGSPVAQLAAFSLAPYLVVFLPQTALETKLMNRSVMSPAIPLLFMYYRLWQLLRALQALRAHPGGGARWLLCVVLSLLAFWVFDTASVLVWLPWTYNWQLQPGQTRAAGDAADAGERREEQPSGPRSCSSNKDE